MKKDDFVVALEGNKKYLIKVTHVEKDVVKGVDHLQYPALSTPLVEVDKDDVVAVLGPEPKIGPVFGVNIEPFNRTVDFENWVIHLWRKVEKEEGKALRKALSTLNLKIRGLDDLPSKVDICVRYAKGNKGGTYKPINKMHGEQKVPDQFNILAGIGDVEQIHEVLHALIAQYYWVRVMSQRTRARWVKVFLKYVENPYVGMREINIVRNTLESEQPTSMKDLMGLFDEDMHEAVNACLGFIMTTQCLSSKDLDALLELESIHDMLPNEHIKLGRVKDMLTPDAQRSPQHLFCEAMTLYMGKKILPPNIKRAINMTLGVQSSE